MTIQLWQAARLLKVAPRTIRKWIGDGRLKATADREIVASDLREFLVRHGMPTEDLDDTMAELSRAQID